MSVPAPPISPMPDYLRSAADLHPHRPALDDGARTWSYLELDEAVGHRARELEAAGAGRGGRVVLRVHPSADGVIALHATFRTGALVAPLHPGLTPRETEEARGVLRPHLEVVWGEEGHEIVAAEAGERLPAGPVAAASEGAPPVAVIWTSGTSGDRRAVLLADAGLRAVTRGSAERLGLGPDDRWYASLSPAHVGGLALVIRAALLGSCLVVRGGFEVETLDRLLEAGEVTHASLVPVMLRRLLEHRDGRRAPATARTLLLGGAHTPRPLVEEALELGWPVALTYGLSEATSQVATAPPELVRRKPGTLGPALRGVELRIGPAGEVEVRGPTVSPGTLGPGADATAGAGPGKASPVLRARPLAGPDGWLRTGDLGELDPEGHLRITGRRSVRIVTGGVTVDPGEVEAALRSHGAVSEVAVVGLPDPEWGERVAAAVVTRTPVEPSELETLARRLLSPAKVPRRWRFPDTLPRNANGKVDLRAVRELFGDSGEGTTPARS